MDFKVEQIDLERIDTGNRTYRITTSQDKPSLDASIRRIGLICPITLKEEENRLVVVSGFRRIRTCRELQWTHLPCRVLPQDATPAACIEIAITDNLSQRALNLIEQARCFRLLFDGNLDAVVAQEIATGLGMPVNRALRSKLHAILSTTEMVQTGLIMGVIGLPTALMLSEMAPDDASPMALLLTRLPMGLNKQREIVTYLKEIAAREDATIPQLLSDEGIQNILEDDRVEGNEKCRQLRSYLRKRRYPRLNAMEENFERCVGELGLGGRVQITPPPGFEGRTCSMTIRFENLLELEQVHRRIAAVLTHPLSPRLFDPS